MILYVKRVEHKNSTAPVIRIKKQRLIKCAVQKIEMVAAAGRICKLNLRILKPAGE